MRWLPVLIISLVALSYGVVQRSHRWGRLLWLGYFVGLSVIVFTPISFDGSAIYVMPAGVGQVNLTHLNVTSLGFVENIGLTVPLGWLLGRRLPRSLPLMTVVGGFIGGGIETVQYVLSQNWLINRSSDISDVLANATGILIGAVLTYGLTRLKQPLKQP